MQHVIRTLVIVVGDIDDVAIRRINRESDVASSALLAEISIKVEPGILNHAHAGITIIRIDEISKRLAAIAAFVITHNHNIRSAFSGLIIKRSP